jgi:hypothetical protein
MEQILNKTTKGNSMKYTVNIEAQQVKYVEEDINIKIKFSGQVRTSFEHGEATLTVEQFYALKDALAEAEKDLI